MLTTKKTTEHDAMTFFFSSATGVDSFYSGVAWTFPPLGNIQCNAEGWRTATKLDWRTGVDYFYSGVAWIFSTRRTALPGSLHIRGFDSIADSYMSPQFPVSTMID